MTLPDEVVMEIDFLVGKVYGAGYDGNRLDKSLTEEIQRIALLTRRLTIKECAKVCDEILARARPTCEANYTDGDSWVATCTSAIRQLEGK